MANLIFASEYVSKNTGAQMWHVYATRDGKKVANTVNGEATVKNEFYFYEPLKALRFAFLLRKRLEGSFSIPKGVYNKLMAAIKAAKPAAVPLKRRASNNMCNMVGEASPAHRNTKKI